MIDNKDQGFTLLEILIAIFILVIGIFGVMALFPVGIYHTGKIAGNTIGAISAEIPLAYSSYKYPSGDSGTQVYHIGDIVNIISGTDTPACYLYPDTGTVTVSGNALYGWNTSVIPIDMDTPGNGTATSKTETYLFRQQIAIYKNYAVNNGTASFSYNSKIISNVSNINKVSVNDFICNAQNRVWYRVTGIDRSANRITLQQNYEYGTASSVSYLSTNTIIGLYNTLLTPH